MSLNWCLALFVLCWHSFLSDNPYSNSHVVQLASCVFYYENVCRMTVFSLKYILRCTHVNRISLHWLSPVRKFIRISCLCSWEASTCSMLLLESMVPMHIHLGAWGTPEVSLSCQCLCRARPPSERCERQKPPPPLGGVCCAGWQQTQFSQVTLINSYPSLSSVYLCLGSQLLWRLLPQKVSMEVLTGN